MNQSPAERILEDLFNPNDEDSPIPIITPDINQAKTQLRDALLEQVIGEDEIGNIGYVGEEMVDETSEEMLVRNQLRAEQRKALYEFFGGSE